MNDPRSEKPRPQVLVLTAKVPTGARPTTITKALASRELRDVIKASLGPAGRGSKTRKVKVKVQTPFGTIEVVVETSDTGKK